MITTNSDAWQEAQRDAAPDERTDNQHFLTSEAIRRERFPNRRKLKINWLQFEQDLRDALNLKIDDIDKLYVIDGLIGEHTGRGYELPFQKFEGSLRDHIKGLK